MGIHSNYNQEYRRAWFCYAISLIIVNIFEILTAVIEHIYKKMDTWITAKMVLFDIFATCVLTTVSTSFILLLYNAYKRFGILNLMLRYGLFYQPIRTGHYNPWNSACVESFAHIQCNEFDPVKNYSTAIVAAINQMFIHYGSTAVATNIFACICASDSTQALFHGYLSQGKSHFQK